ncbi:hypothetical protein BMI79_06405 [Serratia oryzae]|uniref:AraC-type arabinose-binding/dimerisation domain-containing protein n=1 Tax=Serratia oryzae TaxID=2034155 RepID=A0A1S8CKK0_9GAMM|nr:hypothetical protein BMI79_06405 [Serratia oryzae]
MARTINLNPGIGASAHLIQHSGLVLTSLYFEYTHLYLIPQGQTRVRWQQADVVAHAGQLLIVNSSQTVDILNTAADNGTFSCQLLIYDPLLFSTLFCAVDPSPPAPFSGVLALSTLSKRIFT